VPANPEPESVWDYPRPLRIERSDKLVRVVLGGGVIAESARAHRVLETSHPPVYYVPREEVDAGALAPAAGRSTFYEFTAQPGDFYGGWISSEVTGPFKGGPGTLGW
jgi:uncharacterized protein (DUF427 family)